MHDALTMLTPRRTPHFEKQNLSTPIVAIEVAARQARWSPLRNVFSPRCFYVGVTGSCHGP
jgi:hypothetical protein